MFVPFDRKIDWQNPPYITFVLILINIIIFVVFQSQDSSKFNHAYNFYIDSALPEYEIPKYLEYLSSQSQHQQAEKNSVIFNNRLTNPDRYQDLIFKLLSDGGFKKIIIKQSKDIDSWYQLRIEFKTRLDSITGYKYALFASDPTLLSLFSYQFLHADWIHLLGNIIFLFIFGFVIESALSKKIYLTAYIIAGVGSGIFYIFIDFNNANACIGASGAISGLVGIYTVVFAFRKIRFFYYLFFYFNFVKAPAIILLPLWLSYELFLQFWGPDNINNISHIGGLISGAAIAYYLKRFTNIVNINYLNKNDNQEKYNLYYNKALNLISQLEFNKAGNILKILYKIKPNDINVQNQLFNISKHKPTSNTFHKQARNLLSINDSDQATVKRVYNVYSEYTKIAKPPRLSAELLGDLAIKFADSPFIAETEKIVIFLIYKKPDFERIPECLAILVQNYKLQNNIQKSKKYFEILINQFPESREAKFTVL